MYFSESNYKVTKLNTIACHPLHGDKPVCELILGKYCRPTDVLGFAHYDVKWQISGLTVVE